MIFLTEISERLKQELSKHYILPFEAGRKIKSQRAVFQAKSSVGSLLSPFGLSWYLMTMRDSSCFTFLPAENRHVPLVTGMMATIAREINDNNIFVPDNASYIKRHIADEGRIIIALHEDRPAGFLIVDMPGEQKKNLGYDLGWPREVLRKSVHMDSVGVLPDFRGRGLQKALIAKAEELLRTWGPSAYLATVSPDNHASRRSFLAMGYVIGATKTKYGGFLRHILFKPALS